MTRVPPISTLDRSSAASVCIRDSLCSGVAIPWTMPVVLSGFLATGWQGAVLQLLLLILGVFIYMPFIKMMDKQYLADEAKAADSKDDDDIDFDDLSFDDL